MEIKHAVAWLVVTWIISIQLSFAQVTTYQQYQQLRQRLDTHAEIIAFINDGNYLSDRLRRQWLLSLAKRRSWFLYADYYQPSHSHERRCYYVRALFETGRQSQAFIQLERLWQQPQPLPKPCLPVSRAWLAQLDNKQQHLWQRTQRLMKARQYQTVKGMIDWFAAEDKGLIKEWLAISHYPARLKRFKHYEHPYAPMVIIDGLTRWVPRNTDAAIQHWQQLQSLMAFTPEQKQIFYRKVALYAAMRNRKDAEHYFSALEPNQTPAIYHEWRVRAALKRQQWQTVLKAYQHMPADLQQNTGWQYWYARALEKTGNENQAHQLYQTLSQRRHYYGFLASHRARLPLTMEADTYQVDDEILSSHQVVISQIRNHFEAGQHHHANILSYELANDLPSASQYLLAKQFSQWGWHDKALWLANHSQYRHDLRLRFPLAHRGSVQRCASKHQLSPSLVYAIIRQESTFKPRVKSSAGALGLMQVIPSTAKRVSKRFRIPLKTMRQMYNVDKNIEIGTAYLKQLAKRYHKHPVLMAAAYNAGPKQVDYWLRKFPVTPTDIWIETLPWRETRNYLKNIVAFDAVYQYRLEQTPSVSHFMAPFKGR